MPGKDLNSRVREVIAVTKEEAEAGLPRVEQQLAELGPQLKIALPKGLDVQQFTRDAIMLARKTPKLALCEPNSVLGAFMTAAQLGLRPGVSALGQAHILPFWNKKIQTPNPKRPGTFTQGGLEAVFVIGYPGMIELANRSNRLLSVAARAVYTGEEFSIDYGAPQPLTHRPVLDGPRGDLRGFYSDVRILNGGQFVEYWSKATMEAHRDQFALAKTKEGNVFGPWKDHFVQMGRKTMIRQAFNYMPRATELSIALAADNTVRRDWNVIEGATIEDLEQVLTPVAPEDAGNIPDEGPAEERRDPAFKPDRSQGAPPEDEQYYLWAQQNREGR